MERHLKEGRHRMTGPQQGGEGCPADRRRPRPSHLTTGGFRFRRPPPVTKVVTRDVMVREGSRFTEQGGRLVNTPRRGGVGGASPRCSRRGARGEEVMLKGHLPRVIYHQVGGGVARGLGMGPLRGRMRPPPVLTGKP